MLFQLLADEAGDTDSSSWATYVMLGVIVVVLIVWIVISSRRNKKRQQEAENLINAVRPGNKVKTIGGICGIVVEVDDAENTFVLETGTETSGKCFIKFDKQAIYQTDAVATPANTDNDKAAPETEEEDKKDEDKTEDKTEDKKDETSEETAEEPVAAKDNSIAAEDK